MEEFKRNFQGIFIPAFIWLDNRLNALDKVILMEIDSLDCGEKGCYASNEYLAAFCNCSVTKVSTTIKKLKELDFIELAEFDGRHRLLKIKSQTLKNLKADFKNLKSINNNIYNNINTINSINTVSEEIDNSILEKTKIKKLSDKQLKAIQINEILDNFTDNKEIKTALKEYLKIRKKVGLEPQQWKLILDDFRKAYSKRPVADGLQQIKLATMRSWRCLVYDNKFNGTAKTNYSSKSNFDNTANHEVPKGISNMNEQEKEEFLDTLAKDENGNYIKF